jgi:hypothetical protein
LHLEDEVVVVLLCFLHPKNIVEQQVMAIAGRQSVMRKARPAHHDGLQLAHFRVNAETSLHGHPFGA